VVSNSLSLSPKRRRVRGLSMVEALISLAITATLLVAVATAFVSSAQAIEMNDSFFRCSQAARVTMNQITWEIRQCDACDEGTPDANSIRVYRPLQTQAISAGGSPEHFRIFHYDSTAHVITLQITYNDGTTSPLYELCQNVTETLAAPDMGTDYNGYAMPIRIPIMLTVATGGNTIVLSGSAAPRRAVKY
jgi:Tfp pilus assembly protein PilW